MLKTRTTAHYCWPVAAAVCLAACQGDIGSPVGPHSPAGSGPGGAEDVPRADEEMRAENPTLFDAALRYFPGSKLEHAPARLARLTRIQLDLTTQSLLADKGAPTALVQLPRDPLQTNYEYAENLSFQAANFTPLKDWVTTLAASVRRNPASLFDCAVATPSPECLSAGARGFVRRAFRDLATQAQLDSFAGFFTSSVAEVGWEQATADLVDVVLTSPGYLFRTEVPATSQQSLSPAQAAQSLTFTLTDAPPEAVGLAPGAADALASDEVQRKQTIDRLLATPGGRSKLQRFFMAWLEVKEPDEFTIASAAFPEFTPALAAEMVAATRAFLEHVLSTTAPSLKDVSQGTATFVSRGLAAIYGIEAPPQGTLTKLDPNQRLGIFTQPAVLTSHSGPSTTRLVKRGVFFTRKVMCLPLGGVPADVDTKVPELAGQSERERIETATAAPRCQGCHASINPFGFMQENYDPIGRWRTQDQGKTIDPSISIGFLDEGPLITRSPVEALRALTSSARFQQCFVRQVFRFYMGRDELPGDDPTLRQMFFRFANGDAQNIAELLRTLASSSLISARRSTP